MTHSEILEALQARLPGREIISRGVTTSEDEVKHTFKIDGRDRVIRWSPIKARELEQSFGLSTESEAVEILVRELT